MSGESEPAPTVGHRLTGLTRRLPKPGPETTRILTRGFTSLLLKGGSGVIGFAIAVVLGRDLGPEGAGRYFLALGVVTVAGSLVRLGFDQAVTRHVAKFREESRFDEINRLYTQAMAWTLAAGIAVAVPLAAASSWIAAVVFRDAPFSGVFTPMVMAIPAVAVIWLHAHFFQGIDRVNWFHAFRGLSISMVFLALVGGVFLADADAVSGNVDRYGWLYLTAGYLTAIAAHLQWRCAWTAFAWHFDRWQARGEWTGTLPSLWLMAGVIQINLWCPQILLGVFEESDEVGIFTAAYRVAGLGSIILFGINSVIFPRFAVLYAKNDTRGLQAVVRSSTFIMIAVALPFFVFLTIFPRTILGMFGREFLAGALVLQIAAVGQMFNVASGSVGGLLNMSGNERGALNGTLFGFVLTLALCLALIPPLGAVGAAVASSISLSLTMVYLTASCQHRLGFSPFTLLFRRPV